MTGISRRGVLGALGIGAAAGVGLGTGVLIDQGSAGAAPTDAAPELTTDSWTATRGDRYYIGHRGSGDVYPEHSMEAYAGAVAGGAVCVEVSVTMTSDGVLICLHDLTFDRTTTATGVVAQLPSTVLRGIRLTAVQLGPAWAQSPQPQVPLLTDVLRAFGGRLVLCIEAKNDAAYPAMVAAVEAAGLQHGVVIKVAYDSRRLDQAKAAGYPVFAYFGAAADVTADRITALAARLDSQRDYLILPTAADEAAVRQAVGTGRQIWVFPVHRRSEAARFFALGCRGMVTSSLRYVSTTTSSATADTWSFGAIAPGEMTRDPASAVFAPTWSGDELHLGLKGAQHFLTLGQFGPVTAERYVVSFQACWLELPDSSAASVVLAFGRGDDSYFELQRDSGNGYHAMLTGDGQLGLYLDRTGEVDGTALGSPASSPAPTTGQWMTFRLEVTPTTLTWSRPDVGGASVTASDHTWRGGYLHIGRGCPNGVLAFRRFTVS